ncbi:hypothetical protein GCM10027162_15580 [Streptomyces incanus]
MPGVRSTPGEGGTPVPTVKSGGSSVLAAAEARRADHRVLHGSTQDVNRAQKVQKVRTPPTGSDRRTTSRVVVSFCGQSSGPHLSVAMTDIAPSGNATGSRNTRSTIATVGAARARRSRSGGWGTAGNRGARWARLMTPVDPCEGCPDTGARTQPVPVRVLSPRDRGRGGWAGRLGRAVTSGGRPPPRRTRRGR